MSSTFLLQPASAQSSESEWLQTNGPHGGPLSSLVYNPYTDEVWATVYGTAYRSGDQGNTWKKIDSDYYLSTRGAGFREDGAIFTARHKSYDGGKTWQPYQLPEPFYGGRITYDRDTNRLFLNTNRQVFLSNDEGESWTSSTAPNLLYLWDGHGGIVYGVASSYHPNDGSAPISYRSPDNGASWERLRVPAGIYTQDLIEESDSLLYIMGYDEAYHPDDGPFLYESQNQGFSWRKVANGTCLASSLYGFIGLTSDNEILAGHSKGLSLIDLTSGECRSIWDSTYVETEYANSVFEGLVLPGNHILIRTGSSGIWRSENSGDNWQNVEGHGVLARSVSDIHIDAANGRTWAATWSSGGVYYTDDVDGTWRQTNLPSISAYALQPGRESGSMFAGTYGGVYKTTDDGQNWVKVLSGMTRDLLRDEATGVLYAMQEETDVYFSIDEGESWQAMNAPVSPSSYLPMVAIALSPDGALYLRARHDSNARAHGIFRTNDFGNTWERVDNNFSAFPEYTRSKLYFDSVGDLWMTQTTNVYVSRDHGVTWRTATNVLNGISDILETPDGSMWIAHGGGLMRSQDRGATWQDESGNLQRRVISLAWNPGTRELYVGTAGRSMFRGKITTTKRVSIEDTIQETFGEPAISSYPNPTTGTINLTFSLSKEAPVQITLFDGLGRRVEDIFNGHYAVGNHELTIDLSHLPAGLYFYQLQTPNTIKSNALVLVE